MSDLLLMSPPGLPRTGLVGLWDPYRDTYGRNVLPVGAEDFATGWTNGTGETCTVTDYPINIPGIGDVIAKRITGNGSGSAKSKYQCVISGFVNPHKSLLAVYAKSMNPALVFKVGDYYGYSVNYTTIGTEMARVVTTQDSVGSTASRLDFITAQVSDVLDVVVWGPSLNISSVLYPYSAPAGAPGTLQTSLDYSGHGNHLTLGADTNASTDDPTNTGTAWSFDGGDYMPAGACAPLLTASGMTLVAVFTPRTNTSGADWASVIGNVDGAGLPYRGLCIGRRTSDTSYRVHGAGADQTLAVTVVKDAPTVIIGSVQSGLMKACVNGVITSTSIATFDLASARDLELGRRYSSTLMAYLVTDIYLAAAYSRFFTDSEMMRAYRYIKGLMAPRGIAL